jgi:hypothetical protein
MFTLKKETCASCHFFIRSHRQIDGKVFTSEVSVANRALAKAGNFSWQINSEALSCHKGIWDEGVGFPGSSKSAQIAKTRRNGRCYFYKHQPGMLLPAAEKLLDFTQSKRLEIEKYRLAIYALLIAVLGLLLKILIAP